MKKVVLSLVISLAVIVIAVAIGSVYIPLSEIAAVVSNQIFGTALPEEIRSSTTSIVMNVRLPRVLLAFLVGAALSASGAVVQSVLKNPLASPFTLGVSSGAAFGAAIVIAAGISIPLLESFTLAGSGLVFAVLTVVLSIAFASKVDRNLESTTIVLTGMVISLFLNAVITMVAFMSKEKYEIIMKWQAGTFASRGWDSVKILAIILVVGVVVFLMYSRELDILTFGDEQACSLGVNTKRTKWILLGTVAVLTGCAVAFAGVIGFIDLVAPHVVRKLFSSKHRVVVPMSALFGGVFMVIGDLVARSVFSPYEMPVGAITALIGAPFFAVIYFKRRKQA